MRWLLLCVVMACDGTVDFHEARVEGAEDVVVCFSDYDEIHAEAPRDGLSWFEVGPYAWRNAGEWQLNEPLRRDHGWPGGSTFSARGGDEPRRGPPLCVRGFANVVWR